VEALGYSERGAVNSLLFEIAYSANPNELLQRLLRRAIFMSDTGPFKPINSSTVLIEQSLSDFGDADAVLLLESGAVKRALFVEAKVRACQTEPWRIQDEFAKFQGGLSSTLSSSNLFSQLYHKVRFVEAARCDRQQLLHSGLPFPACSTKALRRIGSNPVVLEAVRRITPYLQDVTFLGLVPDCRASVCGFLRDALYVFNPEQLVGWDTSRWGFLCWGEVQEFCEAEGLRRTLEVLEFNGGQIS
jgi:hypothetical protein